MDPNILFMWKKNGEFGGSALKTPEIPVVTNHLMSAANLEAVLRTPNTLEMGIHLV